MKFCSFLLLSGRGDFFSCLYKHCTLAYRIDLAILIAFDNKCGLRLHRSAGLPSHRFDPILNTNLRIRISISFCQI